MPPPIQIRTKIFISYSREDRKWLEDLKTFLRSLEREGIIERWDDTELRTGDKWKEKIEEALEEARIAILLISEDFFASDFIVNKELPLILAAEKRRGLVVMPVLLSPSSFEKSKLFEFNAINDPSMTLQELSSDAQRRIWLSLIDDIRQVVQGTQVHQITGNDSENVQLHRNRRGHLSVKKVTTTIVVLLVIGVIVLYVIGAFGLYQLDIYTGNTERIPRIDGTGAKTTTRIAMTVNGARGVIVSQIPLNYERDGVLENEVKYRFAVNAHDKWKISTMNVWRYGSITSIFGKIESITLINKGEKRDGVNTVYDDWEIKSIKISDLRNGKTLCEVEINKWLGDDEPGRLNTIRIDC